MPGMVAMAWLTPTTRAERIAALAHPVAGKEQETRDKEGGADEDHIAAQTLHLIFHRQYGEQGQCAYDNQQDQPPGGWHRGRCAVAGDIPHAAEKLPHHVLDFCPVGYEYSYQGTQMQQHIEELRHYPGFLHAQQILSDGQVAAAGNGQELRHTLDQAQ